VSILGSEAEGLLVTFGRHIPFAMKTLLLSFALLVGYAPPKPAPIDLKGYFTCRASLDEQTGGVLTCYAATQLTCQQGTIVLAYQKSRTSAIVDTVHVKAAGDSRWVSTASCTVTGGKPRQYFVLFKNTDPSEAQYLHHILRVWGVGAQGKLVEVPAKTIKCLNDDYGA
jgi:hypothetical protein